MTNPIVFTFSGLSTTVGSVGSFSDGAITLASFSVNSPQPILEACRGILKQTTAAGPYKLKVVQSGATLFTVRSVKFGSLRTIDEAFPDYAILDNQYLGTNTL